MAGSNSAVETPFSLQGERIARDVLQWLEKEGYEGLSHLVFSILVHWDTGHERVFCIDAVAQGKLPLRAEGEFSGRGHVGQMS